ncbi:ROT2 [Candida oxycetoniae]|uniref:Glucosidase II subunit alpha n=1 Tax=Candida oxycetoniae TaxID=497107 RepID=A0AAI9SXG2_9ASCO|nr:ROT2 [Candida oxycetoniae]KAI3404873.2 ROT2 [Candida oxycetoniae]
MRVFSLFAIVGGCSAVKDYLFKACADSGFCRQHVDNDGGGGYYVQEESLELTNGVLHGVVSKVQPHQVQLPFEISIVENSFRFRMDEQRVVGHKRYNEAAKWAFSENAQMGHLNYTRRKTSVDVSYGHHKKVVIQMNPVLFTFYYRDQVQLVVNEKQLLHMGLEPMGLEPMGKEPMGQEAIGLDFTLKGFSHLYGIPEHADTMSLKDTSGSEPYRLYNVDIFEYEVDSRLPMYGSIPLLMAVKRDVSIAIFWINSADTFVDIHKESNNSSVHWMSENGVMDFIVIIEDKPRDVNRVYGRITGNVMLPLLASLGYHQCRWNYNDIEDVLDVHSKFDEYQIPYDNIWLDIEYTDNKKYFTWHPENFNDPGRMLQVLNRTGRNLVVIIDPHIKTGYEVSQGLIDNDIAIKNSKNEVYHGHCWPGESIWVDTLHPASQPFWNKLHQRFIPDKYQNILFWNDMNEPSVFDGPETTMPKDNIHYGQWEHRSVHNLYGLTMHEATYKSLLNKQQRPFILTRSFFAGSQRTAAMWTGDNMSRWEYLKVSIPMILTMNIAGMPFAGADVGGFFGDPSAELLTRWYQAGVWYPFFRGHAHIDSRRREPWLAGDPYIGHIRDAIRLRYAMMPVFYTSFYEASVNGTPVIKPVFYEYHHHKKALDIEDEFFLGDSGVLVKPVTDEGATTVTFSSVEWGDTFYSFTNGVIGEKVESLAGGGGSAAAAVTLGDIPMLLKGGSIVPMKMRYRRSTKLMRYDPYTLVVALDKENRAKGTLYVDDGETINGEYTYITIEADASGLRSSSAINVEKVIIVGGSTINGVSSGNLKQEGGRAVITNATLPIYFVV